MAETNAILNTWTNWTHSLISLLRTNARMNIADLAHKLGVSRGTVTNRLRKLEDTQVIVGYTVRLKPEAEPERIRAWMGVLVEGNQTRQVIASLLGEPGVSALHDTNGRWAFSAELEARSMSELSQVLERHSPHLRHSQHRNEHPSDNVPMNR